MKRIFIPTNGVTDWQKLLAGPDKQWRTGYSAKSLANCWEAANGAFPLEIQSLFRSSANKNLNNIEMLLAFPEWKVYLPPRGHPSQNDLFVLARDGDGNLVSIMVEGKVSERFGNTLDEWKKDFSPGKEARLLFLHSKLGFDYDLPGSIRYQLIHRLVSSMLEAERFNSKSAVMIVHSFSRSEEWFVDFSNFLGLFNVPDPCIGRLYLLQERPGLNIYCGWAQGNINNLDY